MDTCVIAALKVRWKRMHVEKAHENIDAGVNNIYKVDFLTAMRFFQKLGVKFQVQ